MKLFRLFLIFAFIIFIDSFLFPQFFNFNESFLSWLILIIPILYYGLNNKTIFLGLCFAFILELIRGFEFGNIMVPFLLTLVFIYMIYYFFDIKYFSNKTFDLGQIILFTIILAVFTIIFLLFLNLNVKTYFINTFLSIIFVLESLVLVLFFNSIFNEKYYT
jgi:hypothetical protein